MFSTSLFAPLRRPIADRHANFPAAKAGRWSLVVFCFALTALNCGSTVCRADDEDSSADEIEEVAPTPRPATRSKSKSRRAKVEDGPGMLGRVSHLALPTFGRTDSITPLEVMPYVLFEDHFFFADVRGFASNSAKFGGNAGVGYRYLSDITHGWYGASAWYDADDTTSQVFQQVGLSFEALVHRFEARSNVYLPVGTTSQTFNSQAFGAHFVGNQLLFGSNVQSGQALRGADYELGYAIPVGFYGPDDRLRGFVGGYNFGDSGKNINGVKARVELALNNAVTTQVLYTNDKTFGSNVMVGISLEYPFGRNHPNFKWRRNTPSPFRYVERNYNVVVQRTNTVDQNARAINPRTGQAYVIEHVSANGSAAGDGSVDNPYGSVAQALAAGGDVVYVHSGTVLHEQISLANGNYVIGEGAHQTLMDSIHGAMELPTSSLAGTASPRITGVNGDAVILANNSTFSGFSIDHILGNGIVGTGVSGATVSNVTFSDLSGDGVSLKNSTGEIALTDLTFNSTPGRGLMIDGGTANITMNGTFNNINGDAVTVRNTTGGTVALNDLAITNGLARGLVAENIRGTLDIKDLTITHSGGDAVDISGGDGTGTINLTGTTTITTPLARGFRQHDSNVALTAADLNVTSTSTANAVEIAHTTGITTLTALDLSVNSGQGLAAIGADSLVIGSGTVVAVGAPAVNIESSDTTIVLTSVSANGGPFGIRIAESTGSFLVAGAGTVQLSSGGVIQNTVNGIILQNAGSVNVRNMDLFTNGTGVSSTGTDLLVLDSLRIQQSTHYAVDSMNDSLLGINGSLLSNNGAIGEGTIRIQADTLGTYQSQVYSNTIVDNNGTAIFYGNAAPANGSSLSIGIQNNIITANRGGTSAVLGQWNGPTTTAISGNTFTLTGANMTGVQLVDASSTDKLTATATSNTFTFSSSGGVGIKSTAGSTANLQYQSNTVTFNGTAGLGMEFALAGAADVWLAGNTITDNGGAATGILFDGTGSGSRVQLDANSIQMLSTSQAVDRGVIFTSVNGILSLYSASNNIVNGAVTPFSIPSGSITGNFLINGVTVP